MSKVALPRYIWFVTILYTEVDFEKAWSIFHDFGALQYYLSPLHDSDFHDDGTPKEPHYHLMIRFGHSISLKRFHDISSIAGTKKGMNIDSVFDMYQYLCHKNNPEKAQYDENRILTNDVTLHYIKQPDIDKQLLFSQLLVHIELENITSFRILMLTLPEQYRCLFPAYTYTVKAFLEARIFEMRLFTNIESEEK